MKAFLMYRDRDFDPQQVLPRRERDSRPGNRDQGPKLEQLLPWNEAALVDDLGLNILFNAMAGDDIFLWEVAKVGVLSSVNDLETVLYRQAVFRDCLKHEAIVRSIYQIAVEAIAAERQNYWSFFGRYPAGILHRAVDVLEMLVGELKALRRIANLHADAFESSGLTRLFAMLRQELSNEYFTTIEQHLRRLKFRNGVLISAELNRHNKGTRYVLRKPYNDQRGWIARLLPQRSSGYTFHLHPRDEAGAWALSELRDQGVNVVANALAQSTDHVVSFFRMLRTELAFYLGCLNLRHHLVALNEPTCFPVPTAPGERCLSFRGLYDACLALSAGRRVVGNHLEADGRDLIVITGANTGGKSTFIRSVGLAQFMMQAGMLVPAERFCAELREGLFTHFKREEDNTMESGKLDEELSRMSDIVQRITPGSMVLLNESFAATNEREGSEIARQIACALIESGVRVLFVTHLHEFAHRLHSRRLRNTKFLRAERRPDGTRTFRMLEAEPLQTSYGRDLFERVFALERPADGLPGSG
jgi:DNA mismatch repair ATPase MutS